MDSSAYRREGTGSFQHVGFEYGVLWGVTDDAMLGEGSAVQPGLPAEPANPAGSAG